jgi:uncharacterized protein YkwD
MGRGVRHGDARTRRRWTTAAGVGALSVAVVAGPVLGSGQPDLATSDADRAAADATAVVDDELTILDGLAEARAAADLAPVVHHPEAARLARDWAQVMADAESREDLATCADLADEAPGPVWHPRDPHLDLGSPYTGDIGEVVGCFAEEVDAAAFLANRLEDPDHAAELLEPTWRHVGVGVVDGPASEATFTAIVLTDGTMRTPDRRGVDQQLAATADRPDGGDDTVVLTASGPIAPLLAASPLRGGAVPALVTDRATREERDPILFNRTRDRIDALTGGAGRVVAVGGTDVLGPRAVAELEAAGHRVWRLAASGYGVSPTQPVVMPADVTSGPHAAAVGVLVEGRVLVGKADGRFDPGGTLTRGQTASILARALQLPTVSSRPFSDTAGDVHEAAIAAAHAAGIIEGFDDGTFRSGRPVTRGQLASLIARAFDLPLGGNVPVDARGNVHSPAVGAVLRAQIVTGFPDGSFRPNGTATRAQTATFVLNSLLHG